MLGTPRIGWSTITVNGKKIGSASYLDWIPGLVITPCIRYLKEALKDIQKWDNASGGYGFNVEFDCESAGKFGIVEIGNDFYTYDTQGTEEPYIRLTELDLEPYRWTGYKFVQSLLNEIVNDIESDFEDWVVWDAFDSKDEQINRQALNTLLNEAKTVLAEIS